MKSPRLSVQTLGDLHNI